MLTQNIIDKTKTTIIRKSCPFCSKIATKESETIFNNKRKVLLTCGHTIIENLESVDKSWTGSSLSNKVPFPYQYKTLDFLIEANFRAGIFHEQGVGKTACSLLPIKRFPGKFLPFAIVCKASLKAQWFKEVLDWTEIPAQIISGSSDKAFPEVFKAFIVSYDTLKNNPSILSDLKLKLVILDECQQIKNANAKRTQSLRLALSGKKLRRRVFSPDLKKRERIKTIALDLMSYHGLIPRFKLSFETLGDTTLGECACKVMKEGIIEGQITINKNHAENDSEDEVIETILHEIAHAITPGAGHRNIWEATCLSIGGDGKEKGYCKGTVEPQENIEEWSIPYVLALSGTPIKNHAGEYFPVLNILKPEIFHSQAAFERDYCDTFSNGWGYKVGGLSRRAIDRFKEETKSFITRYERADVLPDLPKIFRKNFFVELGDEVAKAYKAAYLDFAQEYVNGNDENILAKLNRMRQITGIAKIEPITEFVTDFLEDNDRKYCIFVHHKNVGVGLVNHIGKVCQRLGIPGPLQLTSENASSDAGERINEQWINEPKYRIMIASTQSAGEGKNWQHCRDAMMAERQWNPANEEQPETRFTRPCPKCGQKCICGMIGDKIDMTYALAIGTPDEYLAEIVEKKREVCRKTMGNESVAWNESSIMKELTEALFTRGGKKWLL